MKSIRTFVLAAGATLLSLAAAGTSAAQSPPRYPTPTPVTPKPVTPPDDPNADTATGGTTGAGTSTTRSRKDDARMPGGAPSTTPARSDDAATTGAATHTTAAAFDPNLDADRTKTTYRPNRPLLIVGATLFVGSYATTAVVGAVSDLSADRNLFIPVAGPWMDLADRPCGFGDCGTGEDVNNALLIGGGVTQAAGLVVLLSSLVVPQRRHPAPRETIAAAPAVRLAPMSFGRGNSGIGAVGTF